MSADESDKLPILPWCRDCWRQAAEGSRQDRGFDLPEQCEQCGSSEVFWI